MLSPGVLVIAHGSKSGDWVAFIEQSVQRVQTHLPVEIGYLELVQGKSIADGIRTLEAKGVQTIIVIPLFMTMGSTHLNEIQYALRVIPQPAIETDLTPITHSCKVIWCSPLENHWIVKQILSERIASLSRCPREEMLLLIGHGSEETGFGERWCHLLHELSVCLQQRFGFQGATYATLHPDTIQLKSLELAPLSVITVPVFLSEGYFTHHLIPRKLVGNVYDGKTLLPHPLISDWIQDTIEKALTD